MLKKYATFLTFFTLITVQTFDNVFASDDEKTGQNIIVETDVLDLRPSSHYAHVAYDTNARESQEDADRYRLLMTAIIQGRRLEDCVEADKKRQERSMNLVPFNSSGRVEELSCVSIDDSLDALERGQQVAVALDYTQNSCDEHLESQHSQLFITIPSTTGLDRIDELENEDLSDSSGSIKKGRRVAVDINCSQMPCPGIPRGFHRGSFFVLLDGEGLSDSSVSPTGLDRIDELDSEDLSDSSGSTKKGRRVAVDINCSQIPCP